MLLDDLKQELIDQKDAIEDKFGIVGVSANNPTPHEITLGINSIPAIDTSLANATEADVLAGKTFYSNSTTLKTGTASSGFNDLMDIYFFSDQSSDFLSRKTYNTPSSVSRIRSYLFYQCYNPIDIYFTNNITSIGDYSFSDTPEFRFYDFTGNTHITSIGEGAFFRASHTGINLSNLPSNLTSIGGRGFGELITSGENLVIPSSVTSIGNYAFGYTNDRVRVGSLTMTNTLNGELPMSMLIGLDFNCDFTVPSGITKINSNFNFRGCFNNVTIPASVTTLLDHCFGSTLNDAVSNYHMNSFTFEGTTPPSVGTNFIALQNLENPNFKIFVPDQSVEAYKAASGFSTKYANHIYPVSQRP